MVNAAANNGEPIPIGERRPRAPPAPSPAPPAPAAAPARQPCRRLLRCAVGAPCAAWVRVGLTDCAVRAVRADEVTANLLTGYAASGKARFTVLDAHNGVEHELCIDRRSLAIKKGSHAVIKEPYHGEVQAEIAVNEATVVLIHISGGRRMDLDCIDNRARDLAVLTLRHFVDAHLQVRPARPPWIWMCFGSRGEGGRRKVPP